VPAVWRSWKETIFVSAISQPKQIPHHFLLHGAAPYDGRKGFKGGRKGGHQEKTFVGRPFEGSRFGSGVDTRYLQATWVWGA